MRNGTANLDQIKALEKGLLCGKLNVKLATNDQERNEVFKLRYKVFNQELGEGIPENVLTGLDTDPFDQHCDHLMVISNNSVIGTYRLLPGSRRPKEGFYSETEFDFSTLPYPNNLIVELGRGCIQQEFRKQTTLMSLFWGLDKYIRAQGARYLLGCGSLLPCSNDNAEASFELLQNEGAVDLSMGIKPLEANACQGNAKLGTPQIPQLLRFYIQFGAKVLARPAYDSVFKCHDLLMGFDMEHLSQWGIELLTRFNKRQATNDVRNSGGDS